MDERKLKAEEYIKKGIDKIPLSEIVKLKILSRPSLYEHIRNGSFSLYKLGGRSYVDINEFNSAFRKVELKEKL